MSEKFAFPIVDDSGDYKSANYGITIRQYYAAKAMQGCVSDIRYDFSEDQIQGMASYAFRLADAMIWHEKLEREKRLENMRPDDSPEESLKDAVKSLLTIHGKYCSCNPCQEGRAALVKWEQEK